MNQDRDKRMPSSDSDLLVTAEYRAAATERTPATLDRVVLQKATAATKDSGLREFTALWFRPLAFVATLGLSLALILELTGTQQLETGTDPEMDIRQQASQPAESIRSDAGDVETTEDLQSADSPVHKDMADGNRNAARGKPQPVAPSDHSTGRRLSGLSRPAISDATTEPAPPTEHAPTDDASATASFAEMIEAASKRMPAEDGVTDIAIEGLRQTREADGPRAEPPPAVSAVASDVVSRPCAEEQMAGPQEWWRCIRELDEAGRHEESQVELALFNEAHPDFEPADSP